MPTVTLIAWNPGFSKVGLNVFLREQFKYSLAEAKSAVDTLLERGTTSVITSVDQLAATCEKLTALGVVFLSLKRLLMVCFGSIPISQRPADFGK